MKRSGSVFSRAIRSYIDLQVEKRVDPAFVFNNVCAFTSDEVLFEQLSPMDTWTIIAHGATASVYRATWYGADVAVKMKHVNLVRLDSDDADFFEDSVIHSGLRHPNVISLFAASPSLIVMEFVGGGTLAQAIRRGSVDDDAKLTWIQQLCAALLYIHEHDIVLGDVSCENILLHHDRIKICDFGGAKSMSSAVAIEAQDQHCSLARLSPNHVADDRAADRYAFVTVALCLIESTDRVFDAMGLQYLEREYDKAFDKEAFVKESMCTAEESARQSFQKIFGEDVVEVLMQYFRCESDATPMHNLLKKIKT